MIMVGKLVVSLIWVFWMMALSPAEGQDPMKEKLGVGAPKSEYVPTYNSTFERVKKRGYVICGTNDEFPGFSQEICNNEDGDRWEGFDVDICRAVAAAVFGNVEAIEYEIVDGVSRFTYLKDKYIISFQVATIFFELTFKHCFPETHIFSVCFPTGKANK